MGQFGPLISVGCVPERRMPATLAGASQAAARFAAAHCRAPTVPNTRQRILSTNRQMEKQKSKTPCNFKPKLLFQNSIDAKEILATDVQPQDLIDQEKD